MKTTNAKGITRRGILKAGATTALFGAVNSAFPAGVFAESAGPETPKAILGFIALTDSAPLIIAQEKGFFAKYGMTEVAVQKQASWGATRDNLELGSAGGGIDGAHILSPMPYQMSTGKITKGNAPVPMYLLSRLNLNGQCISVAGAYKGLGVTTDATALKAAFAKARAEGKDVKCAVTFPGGTHDLWMRYWLAANGIDPNKDVSTIVVPPPQMVANMKVNTMEAFCVGEPWNAQLVRQGIGFTALTTGEFWANHPEKAFTMRADWVDANPRAAKALLMAVQEAAQWCDVADNKEEMCKIIGGRDYFKVPVEDILGRTQGHIDYGDGRVVENTPHIMKYWADHASFPFPSHDLWFLTENIRWGYQPADLDLKATVAKVNRADLWLDAAKTLGVTELPPMSRGIETFFDGKSFDPENPSAYLASLAIKAV
ncbi:CmpA/NrtA family ABC transporter substrate-binding protein [Zavarzinia compransoris]|uniref:Bicarbonate-binding protein n=1 Tax=Zavarzinia compransoris TaxID=1264899 RepID=A0A317E7L5_9PROT|nr:CmpA/NrtA family ABC transporter substrate-binding protein [Zavarzinia compransoris]PWR22274.1 bicarbonate-binding protein [Zavarzinia compransoris]TDP46963.1 nitrate/nitrite transport system substrate-binding protein [Zavarzinia compransoris]